MYLIQSHYQTATHMKEFSAKKRDSNAICGRCKPHHEWNLCIVAFVSFGSAIMSLQVYVDDPQNETEENRNEFLTNPQHKHALTSVIVFSS